jgi:N,N'-diacetyllegionaminate synthase
MMSKIFIIAEAGVNHNGSIELAKQMIDVAVKARADAIKFQTFKAEKLVTKSFPKANYQIRSTDLEESMFDMLKKLELNVDAHRDLIEYCKKRNIVFMSTAFDFDSIVLLHELGLNIFKVPSGEITNLVYLRKIGSLGKQVILSTGMTDLGEIEDALEVLIESGTPKENITILHCNTEYPTPFEDVNLLAMTTIKEAFKINIGYSDHTLGIEIPIAAAALGATVIEKHFTLDKNMPGPDHKASLEPHELESMVKAIRNIERAMGNGVKKTSRSELKNKPFSRKSIVAASNIKHGDVFTEENVTTKRPGTGINPMEWDKVIGKKAMRDFNIDELIEL